MIVDDFFEDLVQELEIDNNHEDIKLNIFNFKNSSINDKDTKRNEEKNIKKFIINLKM